MTNQKSKFTTVLLVLVTVATTLFAQVQTPRYIQMSEATKAFYEYLPQGYPEAGQKYPLLIFVHGAGETGQGTPTSLPLVLRHGPPKLINNGTFPTSFTVNAQTFKFIVISPQFTGFPSVSDINNSINYLVNNYAVDINRIYLTGLSMGGGAAWYYPGYNTYFANRLAATVPICGATDASPTYAANIASADLPVWATHNNGDPTVSVSITNTLVNTINSDPAPPSPLAKKTIFTSNSHDAWTQTYNPAFKENGLNIYEWMLQYKRNFVVLAVNGLEFKASLSTDNKINLQWKTTSEINNLGFNIQRSNDGNNFSQITFLSSNAINGSGATYSFMDNAPLSGKNYYRLEMKNNDGQKTYSDIKFVDLAVKLDVRFYPNPVKSVLNILTATPFTNAQLRIRNSSGQFVHQQVLKGGGNIPVSIVSLASGIYYAEIIENGAQQKFDFIKE